MQLGRPATLRRVRTVALCAGSGGSVFKSLSMDVDVLFTGELSHHEVLAAVEQGKYVILCGHSNTERGYLQTLRQKLQQEVAVEHEALEVVISEQDKDPLEII